MDGRSGADLTLEVSHWGNHAALCRFHQSVANIRHRVDKHSRVGRVLGIWVVSVDRCYQNHSQHIAVCFSELYH